MIILILILTLFVSFAIHILFIVRFILTKNNKFLNGFIITTITNILCAGILSFIAIKNPELIQKLDMMLLLWIISGIIMIIMINIQITILRRIYSRAQMPEHYHLNFFGKKVLHPSVVSASELMIFFMTMPVFLIAGAYFIARLINLHLYSRL